MIQKVNIPIELIMDGVIVEKNLNDQYSRGWLDQQLQTRNLNMKDVYYAVISSNGSLIIDLYNDRVMESSFAKQ